MTAPLRFRAWHKQRQVYVPVLSIMFDITGEPISINGKRTPISDVILERWTGRVDRKGTPVFEGDLVQRYINPAGEHYYASNVTLIEWRETATYTGFGLTERTTRRIEVIGNVHQNSELLLGHGVAA